MGVFIYLPSGWIVSTDRISPSASMLDLIRALGAARGKRSEKARSIQSSLPKERAAAAHDLNVLRRQLAMLLKAIDPDDEQAVLAMRRRLLQEIALWEFGSDFHQDPEFGSMLDGIERALMADPGAQARFSRLIRNL